jgi:BTB/POZ domain
MQSNRFTVLVGSAQTPFRVPQNLLMQYSPVFKKMCQAPFKESVERIIRLPEEKTSTFEDLFLWLHALEPQISLGSVESVIDLAIFAEQYHFCHLKNQTSDFLRVALNEERWKVTPEALEMVYSTVPAGTILRQLCFLGFALTTGPVLDPWGNRFVRTDDCSKWERAFNNWPELGWEYFQFAQAGQRGASSISTGGACRFHDHSYINGWVRKGDSICPYPIGAPLLPIEENGAEERGEGPASKLFADDVVKERSVEERPEKGRTVEEVVAVEVCTEESVECGPVDCEPDLEDEVVVEVLTRETVDESPVEASIWGHWNVQYAEEPAA